MKETLHITHRKLTVITSIVHVYEPIIIFVELSKTVYVNSHKICKIKRSRKGKKFVGKH